LRRYAIRRHTFSPVLLLLILGLAALSAGCATTTTVTTRPVATSTLEGAGNDAQASSENLRSIEQSLGGLVGVDPATMQVTQAAPESPSADTVIQWAGGSAEVDGKTGLVYEVSAERAATSSSEEAMTLDLLRSRAFVVMDQLGWTQGTLAGLGFKQEQPGTLAGGAGLYTISWAQYQGDGTRNDGSIVLALEGHTGQLVQLSVWLGSKAPVIEGAIPEAVALQVAQAQIYLNTDKPKISLAGDGSLILIGRKVVEELKVIDDADITGETPRLCWVITVTGKVGQQTVGGTVYLDALTGEVLDYQPYQTGEPSTTTTTLGEPA